MRNLVKEDLDKLAATIKNISRRAAAACEKFSKDRFTEQGWKDSALQPWKKRKRETSRDKGRGILIKSGRLRRSIKARAYGLNITISSDVPYAEAHNEGFKGEISETVGSHSRKSHKRKSYTRSDGKKIPSVEVSGHIVGGYSRKRNMKLPQRRFMGPSAALDKEITSTIEQVIDAAIK